MGYHYALYFIPVWCAKKQEVVNIQQETTYPRLKSDNNLPAQSLGKKNPTAFVCTVGNVYSVASKKTKHNTDFWGGK